MSIVLEQLSKFYAGVAVVDRVSLNIADGELFVLLGTSGSGKSTALRLIAGLSHPDSGRILLRGRDVTSLPPQQRGTGFVFQNYSIFRHMSVAENIEFGLKIRNIPVSRRTQKRDELLELVGMAGLGGRYADQLSGGQQQRVALARALAYEPHVLLLDEPFGALDVKTRSQLRRSLKEVQKKLGVTAILVTHDQDEAFELADHIGVLDRGKLLEVGDPETLYMRPRTFFAATFVGAGTVLVGKAVRDNASFGPLVLPIPAEVSHEDGAPVQVLFRPEQIALSVEEPQDKTTLIGKGSIIEQNFSGPTRRVRLRLPRLPATRQISPVIPFGEKGMFVDAQLPSEIAVEEQELWVTLRGWHILEQPQPHLLVFADGRASQPALKMARWMGDHMNASITLLSVTNDGEEIESRRSTIRALQEEAGISHADLRVRVGDVAQQVIAEQNERLYSLVILPPHSKQSLLRRTVHIDWGLMKLLSRSEIPVMVVPKERPQLGRVLICTAVGEPGKRDVRVGGRLARRSMGSVTLLYVAGEGEEPSRLVHSHLERAAATLGTVDVPVNVEIKAAPTPAKGILAASRENDYDLIVIGNHGPQSRSIFGRDDVMMQVLNGADRPVLVVPEEESW